MRGSVRPAVLLAAWVPEGHDERLELRAEIAVPPSRWLHRLLKALREKRGLVAAAAELDESPCSRLTGVDVADVAAEDSRHGELYIHHGLRLQALGDQGSLHGHIRSLPEPGRVRERRAPTPTTAVLDRRVSVDWSAEAVPRDVLVGHFGVFDAPLRAPSTRLDGPRRDSAPP